MPSGPSRRTVLRSCGLLLGFGAAGCLDVTPGESDSDAGSTATTDDATTAAPTTDATSPPETVAPAEVPDSEAKERAFAAEEAYLTERLEAADCLQNWGATASTASEDATVVERNADGVRVNVRHPYWYSTERVDADTRSIARYLVDAERAERLYGSDVDPC